MSLFGKIKGVCTMSVTSQGELEITAEEHLENCIFWYKNYVDSTKRNPASLHGWPNDDVVRILVEGILTLSLLCISP